MLKQGEKMVKDAVAHMDVRSLGDDEVDFVAGGTGTDWGDDYEGRAAAEGKTWLKGQLCLSCHRETVYGVRQDENRVDGGLLIWYRCRVCYSCGHELPSISVIW